MLPAEDSFLLERQLEAVMTAWTIPRSSSTLSQFITEEPHCYLKDIDCRRTGALQLRFFRLSVMLQATPGSATK